MCVLFHSNNGNNVDFLKIQHTDTTEQPYQFIIIEQNVSTLFFGK